MESYLYFDHAASHFPDPATTHSSCVLGGEWGVDKYADFGCYLSSYSGDIALFSIKKDETGVKTEIQELKNLVI